jgi:hypothetical protein
MQDSFPATKKIFVCSRHFTEDSFEVDRQQKRLRPEAIPTIFDTVIA